MKLTWAAYYWKRRADELHGTINLEHVHRHIYGCQFVKDKIVLDIPRGKGYGTGIL